MFVTKNYQDESRLMITLLMHFLRENNAILVCRPVAALLDITVLKVDKKLKDRVQEDVVQEQGPTDGSVIVSSIDNSMLSDSSADQVMELFAEIGEIILVRLVLMAFFYVFVTSFTQNF